MRTGSGLCDGAGEISAGPVGVEGTAVPRNGVVAAVTLGDTAADGIAVTVTVVVSVAVGVPGVGDGTCAEALFIPATSPMLAQTSAVAATAKDVRRTLRIVSLLPLQAHRPRASVRRLSRIEAEADDTARSTHFGTARCLSRLVSFVTDSTRSDTAPPNPRPNMMMDLATSVALSSRSL